MKIKSMGFAFVFALVATVFLAQSAVAELGNGSTNKDCLQIGTITKLGNRELTIATKFEKDSKTYTLKLHPDAYVQTADRGVFKKFAELKTGELVAVYGWNLDGNDYVARRIVILDPNSYLIKRLESDAKAGVYYKHEK